MHANANVLWQLIKFIAIIMHTQTHPDAYSYSIHAIHLVIYEQSLNYINGWNMGSGQGELEGLHIGTMFTYSI